MEMGAITRNISLVLFLLLAGFAVKGQQVSPLERVITITFSNDKADGIIQKIERQAQINFSYNPSIFDLSKDYNGQFENKTVREILNTLFPGQLQYKEKGNYVILTPSPEAKKESAKQSLIITGYVVDSQTGEKVREASVYDKRTLSAAVTNEYGYFKIEINKPEEVNTLTISKRGYFDQTETVSREGVEFITIGIDPEIRTVEPISQAELDVDQGENVDLSDNVNPVTTRERDINMLNIKDTLYRKAQISVVPFVGTNMALSGNVVNEYSFNIFGGYSMGTSKFEIGGYFNINRAYMHGVQLAGFFNYVGGDVSGLQVAGYANIVKGESHAWQLAGYTNINLDSASKPQIAGLLNADLKSSKGVHIAGLTNIHFGRYTGAAYSGLANFNFRKSKGAMVAGLGNFQFGDYKGFMMSGLTNMTFGKMQGVQISPLLNISGKLKGSQIGILNIADSVSGVQIGFLSFSRAGYHKLELSADEVFYTNVALRTGSSNAFYNIFTAGIKPQGGTPFWTYGYGIGTSPRLTRWLYLNMDLTANQIQKGVPENEFSLLSKFNLGFEFQVLRKFSLAAGATLNSYLTKNTYLDYPYLFTDYEPSMILDENYPNHDLNHKMWIGWKFSLRFL